MAQNAPNKAVKKHREKLARQGLSRFEVIGLECDRQLVRSLARALAKKDLHAAELRAQIAGAVDDGSRTKGAVLAAFRSSPFVGADLDLKRARTSGRKVDF